MVSAWLSCQWGYSTEIFKISEVLNSSWNRQLYIESLYNLQSECIEIDFDWPYL